MNELSEDSFTVDEINKTLCQKYYNMNFYYGEYYVPITNKRDAMTIYRLFTFDIIPTDEQISGYIHRYVGDYYFSKRDFKAAERHYEMIPKDLRDGYTYAQLSQIPNNIDVQLELSQIAFSMGYDPAFYQMVTIRYQKNNDILAMTEDIRLGVEKGDFMSFVAHID